MKLEMKVSDVISNVWQIWSVEASGALFRRHGSEL
jgi:hypothetical protein